MEQAVPPRITAALASQSDTRLRHAMDHLLHRLRKFMRAYPEKRDEPLPDHDVVWVTEFDGGPEKVILQAIRMCPDLWASALPEDVCIVRKADLERIALAAHMPGVTDVLVANGAYSVDRHAAMFRRDLEAESGKY